MMIPSSFKIYDREITVEIVEDLADAAGLLGLADFDENKIKLQSVKSGVCDEQSQIETFYHELVHLLLFAIEEQKLTKDERFVSLFARVLKQSLSTQNV